MFMKCFHFSPPSYPIKHQEYVSIFNVLRSYPRVFNVHTGTLPQGIPWASVRGQKLLTRILDPRFQELHELLAVHAGVNGIQHL